MEVRLHDIVDGECGEDGATLGWRFTLLHGVPLHQGALLLLPHVLLPRPHLKHTFERVYLASNPSSDMDDQYTCAKVGDCIFYD